MKKLLMILLTIVMVCSFGLAVACDSVDDSSSNSSSSSSSVVETKEITSVELVEGMPATVFQGATPSLKNIKIKVSYSDGSVEEVLYGDATKADFTVTCDTENLGDTTASVSYKGVAFEVSIKVVFDIDSVTMPAFVNDFNAQKGETSNFKDKTQIYTVGTEGLFYFSPIVTAWVDDEPVKLDAPGDVEIVASLEILNGEAYEAVVEMANYVEVNAKMASFDFTDEAVGNTFKLTVYPAFSDPSKISSYSRSFEFKVIDAYNAYTATDLLLWDNTQQAVADFRTEKGITADASAIKGIVLHSNISLTASDLPSSFFYHESVDTSAFAGLSAEKKARLEGSLKDSVDIFFRNLGETGTFVFEGNYFTLDASAIPFVMKETGDNTLEIAPTSIVSHANFFKIEGVADRNSTTATESFDIKNLNLIGNLNRQEANISSGGLIFIKAHQAKSNFYNIVSKRWYINAFGQKNAVNHEVVFDHCIFEDSYNCMIYSWGGLIQIKNSRLYGAGGPAIIADHVSPTSTTSGRTGSGGWTSNIVIDEKSTVASYVTSQEAWFKEFNASSAVSGIMALDTLFKGFGRTFTTEISGEGGTNKTMINLAIILKSGDAEAMTFDPISGKVSIGANHKLDFDSAYTSAFLAGFKGTGAPIFQSTTEAGIIAYGGQQSAPYEMLPVLYTLTGGMTPVGFDLSTGVPVPDQQLPLFMQDTGYLNLFYATAGSQGYMGVVLGDYKAV